MLVVTARNHDAQFFERLLYYTDWKMFGPTKNKAVINEVIHRKMFGSTKNKAVINEVIHYKFLVSEGMVFLSFFLGWRPNLRWCWVFLERSRILSRYQFTMHFIEFVYVETKRFVGRNVNVILTRQTCSQRSSMSEGSKRRAKGNYFPIRICYMFLMSKCRRQFDPGLTTSVIKKNAAVEWRIPTKKRIWPQSLSEFANAPWHSVCKYRSCAQTWIQISDEMPCKLEFTENPRRGREPRMVFKTW